MNDNPKRKGWYRNLSITTKFSIVLILTALIPLILLSGFNLYMHAQDILERSKQDLEHLSDSKAELIDLLIEDTNSSLHILGTDPEVVTYLLDFANASEAEVASANTVFQNALDSNPFYEYTYLINSTGTVLISKQLEGLATVQGGNFADREYFKQGMAGNEYIDVLVGRTSKKMGFYFSRPVQDGQGNVLGVAIIKLQGEAVTRIINEINNTQNDMSAILVDHDGIVVSPPADYENWLYQSIIPVSPEIEEKVKARFLVDSVPYINIPVLEQLVGITTSGSIMQLRGENGGVVMGYAPVQQLNWVVGINIPPAVLINRITNLAVITLVSGFIVGLIAVLVAIFVARGITRPISKLALAAQRVEKDRSFEPSDIADVMELGDEIGHLARVFSNMVLALRARIADLRTIFEISQEISAGVGIDETLSYILGSIHNVIPYDLAEIGFYDKPTNCMVIRAAANYMTSGHENTISYYEPEIAHSYNIDDGILARLMKAKGAVLSANMQTDEDLEIGAERKWGTDEAKSYLGVLLKAKNRVIGSIELVSNKPNKFTEDNSRLLTSIAAQAAIEVQNAQEIQEREKRLAEQIQQMDIVIDKDKKSQQVAHILESNFFKNLQDKAQNARKEDAK